MKQSADDQNMSKYIFHDFKQISSTKAAYIQCKNDFKLSKLVRSLFSILHAEKIQLICVWYTHTHTHMYVHGVKPVCL